MSDDADLSRMDSYDLTTIEGVLQQLSDHRQTHINWAAWFEANPDEEAKTPTNFGDAKFHRSLEARYTQMIATIRANARPVTETIGDRQDYLRQLHGEWEVHEGIHGPMEGDTPDERFLTYLQARECMTTL